MAVSTIGKTKRDKTNMEESLPQRNQVDSNLLFSQILEKEVNEKRAASMDCHTLTYGHDSRIHTFEYQKREYHY